MQEYQITIKTKEAPNYIPETIRNSGLTQPRIKNLVIEHLDFIFTDGFKSCTIEIKR